MTSVSTDHFAAIVDPRSGRYTLDDPRYGVAIVAFMYGEPRVLGYLTQTAVRAMPAAAIDDFEREVWRAFLGIGDKVTRVIQVHDADETPVDFYCDRCDRLIPLAQDKEGVPYAIGECGHYTYQVVDVDSANTIKNILGGSSHTPSKLILTR